MLHFCFLSAAMQIEDKLAVGEYFRQLWNISPIAIHHGLIEFDLVRRGTESLISIHGRNINMYQTYMLGITPSGVS